MANQTPALVLSTVLVASACTGAKQAGPSPRDRYMTALEKRLNGDARGYFDDLLALAHEAPDSRAGRRARGMLQGGDFWTIYAAGMAAALAVPAFQKYTARAHQSEPRERLLSIHMSEQVHRSRHGSYCPDPAACGILPLTGTHYVYFVAPDQPLGGDAAGADRHLAIEVGKTTLSAMGIEPRMAGDGYLIAAVGNVDGDPDMDIWTIDEAGEPYHVSDDLRGSSGGGLGL